MVKNRKPLFVSEEALNKLSLLSIEKKMYRGDLVDILVGVKTEEEIEKEYEEKKRLSARIRRVGGEKN